MDKALDNCGIEHDVNWYLIDVTGAPNVASASANYELAYQRYEQHGLGKNVRRPS